MKHILTISCLLVIGLMFCTACSQEDLEDYLSVIYVRNLTVCELDVYMDDVFQFTITQEHGVMLIEDVPLGYHTLEAVQEDTGTVVYSETKNVYSPDMDNLYFIIPADQCTE